MTLGIYCVHDLVAGAPLQPYSAPNDEMAIRTFGDMVQLQDQLKRHPEDYRLYRIASLSSDSLEVTPVNPPACLSYATEHTGGDQ